ncbi:helix-turn-helix domain-containing protein [Streptomyces sp. NPDC091412]|uniref:helix-turn-helix domain-containing protein n=1 Tax=Streptomyces sp. NPDC091412 TaxID=3366002 RepID=UPI003817CE39
MRALPDPDDDAWLSELYRAIGERVRAERIRQGLTQDDVWQAADIDRRTVQNVESGRSMTVASLARIARVLGVPLAALVQ